MDSELDPLLECSMQLPLMLSSLFQLNDFQKLVLNTESEGSSACGSEIPHKEILAVLGIDLFAYSSNEWIEDLYPQSMLSCSDSLSETVIFNIIETLEIDTLTENHISLLNQPIIPVLFEEFLLDDSTSHYEATSDLYGSLVTLDQFPMDNLNFGSFNEMIVCHELCPVSDTFKSLPIPLVLDHEIIETQYDILMNFLASATEHPLSTCDGIYLDWPLWDEDRCKTYQSSIVQNILKETDPCPIDDNYVNSGLLDLDSIFENDALDEMNTEEGKLSLDFVHGGISFPGNDHEFNSSQLLKNGSVNVENVESLAGISSDKVVQLSRNISEFSELNYLLNLQSGASKGMDKPPGIAQFSSDVVLQCSPLENQTGKRIVHLSEVHLTDNIVVLMDNFRKCFFSMLGNKIDLVKMSNPSLSEDNYGFLSISEKMLHDIMNTEIIQLVGDCEQTKVMKSMCVLKRISWCLCFYGVYPAHKIFEMFLKSHTDLNVQIRSLYCLVEDAVKEIEKDIVKSHPSLSAIKEIILSSTQSSKVLIVTEMIFWNQLRLLFDSMGLLYHDLGCERKNKSHVDKNYLNELIHTVDNLLRHFNCLLVSHKDVSETFPFNRFNTIVEYGGSRNSSRISTTLQSAKVYFHYFVKMNVENHEYINGQFSSEIDYDDEDAISTCSFEHLKMFILPIENINIARSSIDEHRVCHESLPNTSIRISKSMDNVQFRSLLFKDTIVVVNTKNIDKEMLISKRTTYQRILSLEKEGTQVVERDLTLPVDMIISQTVCVVWYDCNKIGKNTSLQDAPSFISEYVDNIAANIFSLLSFCFKSCILVFEGDLTLLSSIMEYSDGLYAAAASLGIDLQIFFSHSCDMTAQILLCCIGNVSRSERVVFKRFSEAETLAEAFLTKFPSVNVFTAISILSSVELLVDYFNWTPERRSLEAQKYRVHDESIILFNLLCGYGDMGNSVSGITDCSSSTSLGPDIGSLHSLPASRKIKRKFTEDSVPETTMPVGEFLNVSPPYMFSRSDRPTFPSTKTADYCLQKYKTFTDSKQPRFYGRGVNQSDNQQKIYVGEFDENCSSVAGHPYFSRDIFDLDMPTTTPCKDMKSVFLTDSCPDFSPVICADIKDSLHFGNGNDSSVISQVDTFQNDIHSSKLTRPGHTKTAFSDAICSRELLAGLPWTTEFLNRVREKHKVRQKSFPHSSSASSFQYSGKSSNNSKRKSPSYIDLFRYRGVPARARDKGLKKSRLMKADTSKNSRNVYVLPSTWTPLDKRSKKALKFAVNENGSQSKLVWSSSSSDNIFA